MAALLMFGFRVRGQRNVPRDGPVVLVCNHQSHLDPPLVGSSFWRVCNYLARETLFHFGPLGWLIRSLDAIPLDRDGLGMSGLKETLRRLKRGEMVLVFPEGTRSPDGRMQPFKPGFLALARRSGATIVPVAIAGAYYAWPRRQPFPRPHRIRVQIGPPLSPDEIAALDDTALLAEVYSRVAHCLTEAESAI